MQQIVPLSFTPDIDTSWAVNPGALTFTSLLAPLQNGAYASTSVSTLFSLTGTDIITAYLFRQISGSVRLLVFRKSDIDEYDSVGTRTNRGTLYNAATTDWSAAAWGNQIIAVNYLDAPQSSTGAGFSALAGSPPKARLVAANQNFVMLADVDDGGSNVYADMVWWSGVQNPATWTPNIATQAGNYRLLDVPGSIRAMIPYRDTFVAFKDNAIFVGEYVGPQAYIFSWRLVSARVGCMAPKAIAEMDGKLYFFHTSGFWEFDGQSIRNVGIPVIQSFLSESGYLTGYTGGVVLNQHGLLTPDGIARTEAWADDAEAVVWFRIGYTDAGTSPKMVLYGYNPRSGKWARNETSGGINGTRTQSFVRGTTADMQSFKANTAGRVWFVQNGTGLRSMAYPGIPSVGVPQLITGIFGSFDGSGSLVRVWPRMLKGSSQAAILSGTATGYTTEDSNITNGSSALVANTEFDCIDGVLSSKFKSLILNFSDTKTSIIAGLGIEGLGGGKR